jgi:hypothetical protein
MNHFIEPNHSHHYQIKSLWWWKTHHEVHGTHFPMPIWNKKKRNVPICFFLIVQFWTSISNTFWHILQLCPSSLTNNNSFARVMYCIFYHHVLQAIHCDIPSNICIITFPSKHTTNFVCNKTILLATGNVTCFHFTHPPSLGSCLGPIS